MKEDVLKILDQVRDESDFFNKSRLLNYLSRQKDVPLKDMSEYVGIKPSYLCHIMRLERIPEIVLDGYYSELVSITHLFILARIKDKDQIVKAYEEVLAKSLTSVQTEALVRRYLYSVSSEGEYLTPSELEQMTEQFHSSHPGMKVKVLQTRIHSKITVTIPGNLESTTPRIKELMRALLQAEEHPEGEQHIP